MNRDTLVLLLLQISLMLIAALLVGRIVRRLGFPALVGELFGGIIIGPTVLGTLFPDIHGWLFPAAGTVALARESIIQIGLLLFLFIAGLEVQFKHLADQKRTIALTSLLGVTIPFVAGVVSVLLWPDLWQMGEERGGGGHWVGPLFVGTILSISALPVIARILIDLNLIGSSFGATVLAAATIDDLIGWSLFGIILSQFGISGRVGGGWLWNLVLVAALMAVILSIGTMGGRRVLKWITQRIDKTGSYVQLMLIVVFLAAAGAEWIGTHAIFGAFLVGAAVARTLEPRRQAYGALRSLTLEFFVPLYMVSIGLRTNFATNFDVLLVAVVLAVATFGKLAGAATGAWLGGRNGREALAIGFALNARGAMGIVLTTVALDFHLISERVFVALIFMAVATSAIGAAVIPKILSVGRRSASSGQELLTESGVSVGA
ncbi:MAG: cation:proton antiporter [Gemmatimonadaceae bacterium]